MLCPSCRKNPAIVDKKYGVLDCVTCKERKTTLRGPGSLPEFTSDAIKEQRDEFYHDYHPSHRNGEANSEYRDRWGREAMKRQGFSDKEIDNAKPVYRGSDTYYKS